MANNITNNQSMNYSVSILATATQTKLSRIMYIETPYSHIETLTPCSHTWGGMYRPGVTLLPPT